jgi:DNA/RNA-binding domain of Phe-tRNA-synthetase-like protein
MTFKIVNKINNTNLIAGIVFAEELKIAQSPSELVGIINAEVEDIKNGKKYMPQSIKEGIRNLLRKGGFKPVGRNKPASEYLYQKAIEGIFPLINNCVDINNLVSIKTFLPISMLDANVLGVNMCFRYGLKGEQYVFNNSGQVIELEGLCCLCGIKENGDSIPLGNPVKDSMKGKLRDTSSSLIAAIYSSRDITSVSDMQKHLELFEELLEKFASGRVVEKTAI